MTDLSMDVFPNQLFPNVSFRVRSAVFTMELRLFLKFFSMNVADSIVTTINILQIIESSSPYPATLEILFFLFRTRSFMRFTNDLDSADNSHSVPSFPMTKLKFLPLLVREVDVVGVVTHLVPGGVQVFAW